MSAAPVEVQQAPEPVPARPRAGVRADLGPELGVLCAVAVLGLPLGALWSWLAPPELQPFGVAVTYCITTAWNGTDNLCRECR